MTIILWDNIDFKRNTIRDQEWHLIMIKWQIHQKVIAIPNTLSTNNGTTKYMKETLVKVKEEIDCLAVIVGEFNITFSITDGTTGQEVNKSIGDLNSTIRQRDLTDMKRTLHTSAAQWTFFWGAQGIFSMINP